MLDSVAGYDEGGAPEMSVEERRALHLKLFHALLMEMIGRILWSREEIVAHRTQAFRSLLRHAKTHSPWYAGRLDHIDAETATLDDLKRVPVMTKHDLMEHWDEIVTVPGATRGEAEAALRSMKDQFYIWGDHVLLSSGGTGGRPGLFVYDFDSLAQMWAGMSRGFFTSLIPLAMAGVDVPNGVRMATVGGETSGHGSFVLSRVFSNPANPTTNLSGWRTMPDNYEKLNEAQPHFIFTYPSVVAELCEAQASGKLKIAPRILYFGGEQLPQAFYDMAKATWPDADILTCWGTSEGGGTFPCRYGGYHVCEDLVVIEPVDGKGEAVAPGTLSSGIYFTNLYNKVLPIIRYAIDDVFEFDDQPCPCGAHHAKVRQVHGRWVDSFHYDGISILPVTLELAVLEQPNILEYQIQQTKRGAHFLYMSHQPVDEVRVKTRMLESFDSFGLKEAEVSIEKVDGFARTKAGKLKHFLPLEAPSPSS